MVRIIFKDADGSRHEVDVRAGDHLMQAALDNGLNGMVGECGGACACATCHVFLEQWVYDMLSKPMENEVDMLDFVAAPSSPTSRLGCQVVVNEAMDGMIVVLPEMQV